MTATHTLINIVIFALIPLGLAQKAQVGVVTELQQPVSIFWVNHQGEHVLNLEELKPLQHKWINTFVGHRFVAKEKDSDVIIDEHVVTGNEIWVIEDPNAEFRGCKIFDSTEADYELCFVELRSYVLEDSRLKKRRVRNTQFRQSAIVDQVKMVPEFTSVGFAKTKVPEDIWSIVMEYYNHNKNNFVREVWTDESTVVNFWESPTYMIPLPETGPIKPMIYNSIRAILEEWIGGRTELEPTSMYGVRLYLNNSFLENHVDRLRTHAVSAIINVDQDVDSPWNLHIHDHDGNLHEIEMAPGDMVLYESARAIHGRPIPLNGKFYANFFVHFAPIDKELWYFQSDDYRQCNQ